MKPRTKVPAALVDDLKRFATNSADESLSLHVLWLDPVVYPDAPPMVLARVLAWVAYFLGKRVAKTCDGATDCESEYQGKTERAMLTAYARELAELAVLQRRVARVIEALLAAAPKGGTR